MNKSLWMFPGQGNQTLEMLRDVAPHYFASVAEITGKDYRVNEPDLSQTIDIQLTLLITAMNAASSLQQEGLTPHYVAGHSLGAFSAAFVAGVLTKETAIELVYHRASLMQSLYPTDYGMGVIIGLTRKEVEAITQQHFSEDKPCYVSNQNEELQLTISGHLVTIDQILAAAQSQGAGVAKRLAVPTPSHSILMQTVATKLAELTQNMTFNEPTCAYLGNCTGRLLTTKTEIIDDLINNVVHPVQWLDMMQVAVERGIQHFIELPPGRTLTQLVERSYPNVLTYAVDQYSIADTAFLYQKRSQEE